jgi:hypothetical protein
VSRLPPFDFYEHKGKAYLQLKSNDIAICKYPGGQSDAPIAIVPTDEDRLQIMVIPLSLFDGDTLNSN